MNSCKFPLSSQTKQDLLEAIFGNEYNGEARSKMQVPVDSYFCYYRKLLESCQARSITRSHNDVVKLMALIKSPEATRNAVVAILSKRLSDDEIEESHEILEDATNLAVKLLLMVSTGGFLAIGRPVTLSGETKISWKEGTIRDLVNTRFIPQTTLKEHVKLEKIFNARNLERIAGIEIRWTSNFTDHLRMRDDETAVEIFHYASFLKLHKNSQVSSLEGQIEMQPIQNYLVFPEALIDETLQTLALLLPEHDKDVDLWFSEHQAKHKKRRKLLLDPLARECGQLKIEERQIDNFKYWHDRLVILKQVFDEAEPSNIKEWWHDRRKGVQWYTFWVAALILVLTITFGFIQCIEGALQVWLAYKSTN